MSAQLAVAIALLVVFGSAGLIAVASERWDSRWRQRIGCCCGMFAVQLRLCDVHGKQCPDVTIVRTTIGYGLPIRDGGDSYIRISFCPFCGKKLRRRES